MKTKLLGLIASMALLVGATVGGHASPYVVTLDQVGANVVATGSGELDLVGLTGYLSGWTSAPADMWPLRGYINTGPTTSVPLDAYTGFTGPTSYGSGGGGVASTGSGPSFEIWGNAAGYGLPLLWVPAGYTSGTAVSDTATYDSTTLAALGATPGTYVWTWGGDPPDQSFTLVVGQTPIPAALPLFATGLGAMGLFGWRRKRKSAATLAAA